LLGYERAAEAVRLAREKGQTLRATVLAQKWLTWEEFDAAISPEAVCRLGSPDHAADSANPANSANAASPANPAFSKELS
jgi:aspartate ammonia-lyase